MRLWYSLLMKVRRRSEMPVQSSAPFPGSPEAAVLVRQAAVTSYHSPGGLQTTETTSHSSGGWQSKITS